MTTRGAALGAAAAADAIYGPANVLGRSRSTGRLGLPHDHAARAAGPSSAIASSIPTKRSRSSKAAPRAAWSRPPDANAPADLVHAEYLTDPGRLVDESHRTSLIVDPSNGRMPPLDAGRARAPSSSARGAAGPGTSPAVAPIRIRTARCSNAASRAAAAGAPMPTLYNNNIRITQAPGYVAIVHEMVHETRLVPLDGSPFGNVRSYTGESRGHWEGDTLVVETRNFNGKAPFRGAGDEPARHRALHARRRRQGRLQGHVRGRHAVDAAVDGGVLDAHGRRRALRVRVPRRQLWAAQHPRERARRGAKSRGGGTPMKAAHDSAHAASALLCCVGGSAPARITRSRRSSTRISPSTLQRHDHEDGVDQSALVAAHRRQERRRHDDAVDDRRRDAEHAAAPRLHARSGEGRHGDHDHRLSRQERRESRQRPRPDPSPTARACSWPSPGTGAPGRRRAPSRRSSSRPCAKALRVASRRDRGRVDRGGAFLYSRNTTPVVLGIATSEAAAAGSPWVVKLHAQWCPVCMLTKGMWSRDRANLRRPRAARGVRRHRRGDLGGQPRRSRAPRARLRIRRSGFRDGLDPRARRPQQEIVAWINGSRDFAEYRAAVDSALATATR